MQDYETAAQLYEQAIALDPAFAEAHARLAAALAYIYRNATPTAALKVRARAEADKALQLQPNLGEGHLALALYHYRVARDFEATLAELKIAERLLPNDVEVETVAAFVHRRQGHWRESLHELGRAFSRDPFNAQIAGEILEGNYLIRQWPAAARAGDRAIALAPELPRQRLDRGYVEYWWHGNLAPLQAAIESLPQGLDPDGSFTWLRWDAALLQRDFPAAQRALDDYPAETLPAINGAPLPKSYLAGCLAVAQVDPTQAAAAFARARPALEAISRLDPARAQTHARLGLLYAYLGRKEEAIREGRRAAELLPESKDAFAGAMMSANLALIYARTGEADQALTLLERLLHTPGPVYYEECAITLSDLRLRWQWDPLRGDPRFRELLAGPEPPTAF